MSQQQQQQQCNSERMPIKPELTSNDFRSDIFVTAASPVEENVTC